MRFCTLLLLSLWIALSSCTDSSIVSLHSPDREISIHIHNERDESLLSLVYQNDTLIAPSPFGLLINDRDASKNVQVELIHSTSSDETWATTNGKQKTVRDHHNAYTLEVKDVRDKGVFYQVNLKLYNDGWAYRYLFPVRSVGDSVAIGGEVTRLNFRYDFTYWSFNGENHNIGPLLRSETQKENAGIPMVLQVKENLFMALHEAAILHLAPFTLDASGEGLSVGFNVDHSPQSVPFHTSWRAFLLGEEVGDLVSFNLLVNLNEPSKIEDTGWIKPGKLLWDWRVWGYRAADGFEYGLNTESHLRMIDFAAENNIQYLLIDADWYGEEFNETSDPTSAREGIDIERCMEYAQSKKVGIILYLNDVGAKKFGLEKVLQQFAAWGAVGVKYGFMTGTPADKVEQTRKVIETCAKYRLMVDFHDNPIPPSGDRRTWPNVVTREYGHAQADAKRSYFPETAVNTALVNMIAGPLDMTNGWFDLNNAHSRVRVFEEIPGTVAAEVAKLIVVHTGWMVLPDSPEEYLKKEDLFDCIRKMPAQFDSFRVLGAELDGFISVARQARKDWFIGTLTNREPRSVTLDLGFLPQGGRYSATLYEDARDTHFLDNKEAYTLRTIEVDTNTKLQVKMAPGGGHAIYLTPLD